MIELNYYIESFLKKTKSKKFRLKLVIEWKWSVKNRCLTGKIANKEIICQNVIWLNGEFEI